MLLRAPGHRVSLLTLMCSWRGVGNDKKREREREERKEKEGCTVSSLRFSESFFFFFNSLCSDKMELIKQDKESLGARPLQK